jgi:dipeptidase E
MKLFLSSYKLGNKPEKFTELFNNGKKVAVISNALDMKPDGQNKDDRTSLELDALKHIGLEPETVDLREYFGRVGELATKLSIYDGVWVRGGNSFVLNQAMGRSGFSEIIKQRLNDNNIVYGGYSAGIVVLPNNLKGIEIVDNPNEFPEGYNQDISWEGLNLLPYHFAVHYKSDHPESEAMDKVVEYYEAEKIPFRALKDGEAIIINGNLEEKVA